MDLKPYIAIFFTIIFFGKFLMLDAKFMAGILDSKEVAYVNPFCEKNKTDVKESEIPQVLLPESKTGIVIDFFCNAPFHFEIVSWKQMLEQPTYQIYSYTTPNAPEIFRESFYPPPKVA